MRIVGGTEAANREAPYQCSILWDGHHNCGCAILSTQWIITAAHCVKGYETQRMQILVGTNDLKSGGTHYSVQSYIVHEKNNRPKFANDIAVIRVNGPIAFTENVQPIALQPVEVPDGTLVKLTGWGQLSVSSVLQLFNTKSIEFFILLILIEPWNFSKSSSKNQLESTYN